MNKGFRFFVSLVLAAALMCGAVGCFAEGTVDTLLPGLNPEDGSVPEDISLPGEGAEEEGQAWTEGSIVTFGRYPQTEEGTDETPIEWIVLKADRANHRALLISKYALDAQPYNTEDTDVTWETCSLRMWLNNDFLNRAFSAEEQAAILLTDVDNSSAQGYSEWNTSGGNNTQDRIFLLSCAEAKRYFNVEYYSASGINLNTASQVVPTDYAHWQKEAYTDSRYTTADGSAAGSWWLRSPGDYQYYAAFVYVDGGLNGLHVNEVTGSVRPALWISLDAIPSAP